MDIQAAVTNAKGAPFEIETLTLGGLADDEVLVEVRAAGICHTDLIVRDQWYPVPLPAVLGHEGAGIVAEVGRAVTTVTPGDQVAMSFGSCGHCPTCLTGRPSYCHRFFEHNFAASRPDGSTALTRDGEPVHSHFFAQSSFATRAVATERNVVPIAGDVPLSVVAPFGCGVQTGAGAVLNSLAAPAGSSIVVFGTGTVGLAAIMAAQLAGLTKIIGVDVRPQRLQLARELGATDVVRPDAEDVIEAVRAITGAGADYALETTGIPAVLRAAVDCTAPTGQTGVIGAPAFGTEVTLDVNTILTAGRCVRGIVEGDSVPATFIPRLLELWRNGRFPVERLISTYDFDQIDEAAHRAETGAVVKAVLQM